MTPKLYLRRGKEESLQRRHPWVFSGAVMRCEGDPSEGDLVDVYSASSEFLGRGHYQPDSITVRILTFSDEPIDPAWWENRFCAAAAVRKAAGVAGAGATDCYRLVHGEGDHLPGLIVDVYGSTAVIQCHSAGMYYSRGAIADALLNALPNDLTAVYDKSSQSLPYNAGIKAADGYLYGEADGAEKIVLENGNRFIVDFVSGQKTGFFLDQRDNRALVGRYSAGRRVLNAFCYTGGFSVYALAAGASEVCSVDSSASATRLAGRNAELNGAACERHRVCTEDAFEFLKTIPQDYYDLIILDPPAFAKHRRAAANALQGYRRLNAKAISKIAPGGILFTFSCSQAIGRDMFRTAVFTAAAIAGRRVRILHQLSQPSDHPINIYHPEGEYLKGLVLYVE